MSNDLYPGPVGLPPIPVEGLRQVRNAKEDSPNNIKAFVFCVDLTGPFSYYGHWGRSWHYKALFSGKSTSCTSI